MLRANLSPVCLVLLAALAAPSAGSPQSSSRPPSAPDGIQAPAMVRSVDVVTAQEGPAVEIITSRPLVPMVTPLENPSRLVIDLPQTSVRAPKRTTFRNELVSKVRMSQFRKDPPVTRIVVDLLKPSTYSWDSAGNRLTIRLRAAEPGGAKSPSERGAPAMVPVNANVSPVVLDESKTGGGSTVTAGAAATVLRLARGGEVRVCPGTTVSLTYSQNRRNLMLGISTGALEAHYTLDASADSVFTPDFRILLAGPGRFDYGISADAKGNTCVNALPGNTASVIVSELMGDGAYQVKPSDRAMFPSGRLKAVSAGGDQNCGCPEPSVPVLRTSIPPQTPAEPNPSAPKPDSSQASVAPPETMALPPSQPSDVHVQVEAPFVFRADQAPPAPGVSKTELKEVSMAYFRPSLALEMTVLPPPAPVKPRTFAGMVKGFFAAIFR